MGEEVKDNCSKMLGEGAEMFKDILELLENITSQTGRPENEVKPGESHK